MARESFLDGLLFLQSNKGFLGYEFLTWLWYTTEARHHKVTFPDLGEFLLYIDDKIVLGSASGSVRESTLKGGTPAYSAEALSALREGKFLQKAKFILQDTSRQWSFLLCGEDFSVREISLPSVSEADSHAHIAQRVAFARTLFSVLERLFKSYMDMRLSPAFSEEMDRLMEWMEKKDKPSAPVFG